MTPAQDLPGDGRRLKTVLVTGIGGHVGQGILRNLRTCGDSVRIVGTDVAASTAGHHYCDAFQQVPYAYDPAYPAQIEATCAREAVDLVIPATDYEAYHLTRMRDRLPPVLASPEHFTHVCLDKLETAAAFAERRIPFVETLLPSRYDGRWSSIVVKPREGRGSRDVHFDPPDWRRFDDTFIVQRRLVGPELSTALYVDRARRLVGHATFERTLFAGYTLRASLTRRYDREIDAIVERLVGAFETRGPCNIQSIATAEGVLPFELNSRYSAICAFSSQFGFDDVRYAVDEYLFGRPPGPPRLVPGFVHRLFVDVVYRDQSWDATTPGSARSYIFADPRDESSRRASRP